VLIDFYDALDIREDSPNVIRRKKGILHQTIRKDLERTGEEKHGGSAEDEVEEEEDMY